MELGHLLTGQAIIISSILSTILLTENTRYSHSLRNLTEFSFIRVSGEKGAILILLCISILHLIIMEFIASQARISRMKRMVKRTKKAIRTLQQSILITFIVFVAAYTFQSVNYRTSNLIGIGLITMNMNSMMTLIGFNTVGILLYLSYVISIVLVMIFTFIKGGEAYYSMLVSYINYFK